MSLSAPAVASANAQETGEAWVYLLDLSPPGSGVLRYTNNDVALVSGGQTYEPLAFRARLSDQVDGGIPAAQIELDDTLRVVSQAARESGEPIPAILRIVLGDTPDVIEREIAAEITSSEYSGGTISGTLTETTVLDEQAVQHRMTPGYMPGLSR